ncbi:MAG: hypothetical protein V4726_03855 [Verrucomicrobiota bacterium]
MLVLVSDLHEGRNAVQMLKTAARPAASGVRMIALLALSDGGRPCCGTPTPPPSPRWTCRFSPALRINSPTSWPPP